MVRFRGIRGLFHFLVSSTRTAETATAPDTRLCGSLSIKHRSSLKGSCRKSGENELKEQSHRIPGQGTCFRAGWRMEFNTCSKHSASLSFSEADMRCQVSGLWGLHNNPDLGFRTERSPSGLYYDPGCLRISSFIILH